MDADLDTLATGLYVTTDDFLADNPQYRPWRPRVGLAPRLTDAELVTLVVLQALLGFTSEARFLRYANLIHASTAGSAAVSHPACAPSRESHHHAATSPKSELAVRRQTQQDPHQPPSTHHRTAVMR